MVGIWSASAWWPMPRRGPIGRTGGLRPRQPHRNRGVDRRLVGVSGRGRGASAPGHAPRRMGFHLGAGIEDLCRRQYILLNPEVQNSRALTVHPSIGSLITGTRIWGRAASVISGHSSVRGRHSPRSCFSRSTVSLDRGKGPWTIRPTSQTACTICGETFARSLTSCCVVSLVAEFHRCESIGASICIADSACRPSRSRSFVVHHDL